MKKLLFTAAALLLLTSCATDKTGPACPQAGLLQGAATIPVFADGSATKGDLKVLGNIGTFRGACRYKKDGTAEFHLELDFMAKKLEKAGALKGLKLPYFVAVLSPDETVLQKDRFWIKIDFDNTSSAIVKEEHDIKVPVQNSADGLDYKIVFGFELTPEQRDFNEGRNIKQ